MQEVISYLKKKNVGYEIYSVFGQETSNEIFNDKVTFTESGTSISIGIRVALGNKIGFCYTDSIKDYKRCVDAAIISAKSNEPDKDFPGFGIKGAKGRLSPNKEILEITPEWLRNESKEAIKGAQDINKNIHVSEGGVSKHLGKIRLITSEGLDVEESYGKLVASFSYSLKKGDVIENVGIMKAEDKKFSMEFGNEAAKRLETLFGRKSINSGDYQLLLHPDALSELLSETYAFSINAENVHLNKSRFGSKLNQQVFSKKVSILDDGLTNGYLASRSFDAEGTKTKSVKIIDNGVLRNFIYDRKYAKLSNNNSTGNAGRAASSIPSISTNNVFMKEGNAKDIFRECDNAIYVRGLLGTHTMNEASGDFSLGVQEGHLIKNGKVISPLKGVIIAGNLLELMNKVTTISKKTIHVPHNGCSYVLPYVLFDSVAVTSS